MLMRAATSLQIAPHVLSATDPFSNGLAPGVVVLNFASFSPRPVGRTSEPNQTRIIDFESEVRKTSMPQHDANMGFGTLACRITTGRNGMTDASYFAGFWPRQQRIGTRCTR
jgi:hypothetical protein